MSRGFTIGELKQYTYDGTDIWIKKITDCLYVINGMYCAACIGLDMDDPENVLMFLWEFDNPLDPYPHDGTNDVVVISRSAVNPNELISYRYHLGQFGRDAVIAARAAFAEYRALAAKT